MTLLLCLSQYMEKLPGGGCMFRSQRNEDKARQEYEHIKQSEMEKLYRKIEEQMAFENVQGQLMVVE